MRSSGQLHSTDALRADDPAPAPVAAVQVVERDAAHRGPFMAQVQKRDVLDVDLQIGDAAHPGRNLDRGPEDPARVVDLVDDVEQDPAAELAASAVGLAIVDLRSPIGEIGAARHLADQRRTDLAPGDRGPHARRAGVVSAGSSRPPPPHRQSAQRRGARRPRRRSPTVASRRARDSRRRRPVSPARDARSSGWPRSPRSHQPAPVPRRPPSACPAPRHWSRRDRGRPRRSRARRGAGHAGDRSSPGRGSRPWVDRSSPALRAILGAWPRRARARGSCATPW